VVVSISKLESGIKERGHFWSPYILTVVVAEAWAMKRARKRQRILGTDTIGDIFWHCKAKESASSFTPGCGMKFN
jgi:hypothetical protein